MEKTIKENLLLDDAVNVANIEKRGDHAYHCGEKMDVRSGLLGPDFAACHKCGIRLLNMASPHINGGRMPDGDNEQVKAGRTWSVVKVDKDDGEGEG
jgi:hypothetical protein